MAIPTTAKEFEYAFLAAMPADGGYAIPDFWFRDGRYAVELIEIAYQMFVKLAAPEEDVDRAEFRAAFSVVATTIASLTLPTFTLKDDGHYALDTTEAAWQLFKQLKETQNA